MTRRLIAAITLSLCFVFASPTMAQDKPDAEKIALLKKLFALMNIKSVTDTILGSSLGQVEGELLKVFEGLATQNPSLTGPERAEIQSRVSAFSKRVSTKLLTRMQQKIDFVAATEQIMIPLYDRQFTINEVKDLITFYESSTGQKLVKAMPQITQEAMQKSTEALTPQVMQIMTEIMEEEKDAMEALMKSSNKETPPPTAPKPAKTTKPRKR